MQSTKTQFKRVMDMDNKEKNVVLVVLLNAMLISVHIITNRYSESSTILICFFCSIK